MDFIKHYVAEAGTSTSMDRIRKRYRAKITQDIHKTIDPCSWVEQNGGVYADVTESVYNHLKSELDGDVNSDPLSKYRITGPAEDSTYESKVNVKSTKCANVFVGKPEPEAEPEPDAEPEPEDEGDGEPKGDDGVDVRPVTPEEDIPEGNAEVDETHLNVRFKESIVSIPFTHPWFENPLAHTFTLDEKSWYLIPMVYPTVLKSGKTIDTAKEVPAFVRKAIQTDPKFGYKGSPFVWILKETLEAELTDLTREKTGGEPEQSATGENGPWIKKFTTRGSNPVQGYKIDIENPGVPPKIKDFVIKYRDQVNAERKKKDPKAGQDIGNIIFVVADDMPQKDIPKDVSESMIVISRKQLDEILSTCASEYITETMYFMELFGKKKDKEGSKDTEAEKQKAAKNADIRAGLNLVKAHTYKTKNGGKITFAHCIYHTKQSAGNTGSDAEEPTTDEEQPKTGEAPKPKDKEMISTAESFIKLYEAEEKNIDPNVKDVDVATGQHKFIIGFDKNAVKWVSKICKKTPAQVCAEGSFGPSWKSGVGKGSSGQSNMANLYAVTIKTTNEFYATKIIFGKDDGKKKQLLDNVKNASGRGVTGQEFEPIETNIGYGTKLVVQKGTIYIIDDPVSSSNGDKPEIWFKGNITKEVDVVKQILGVLCGVGKDGTEKLVKFYKVDKASGEIVYKARKAIVEKDADKGEPEDTGEEEPGVDMTAIKSEEIQKILNNIIDNGYDSLTYEEKKTLQDYKKTNAADTKIQKLIDDVIAMGKIESKPGEAKPEDATPVEVKPGETAPGKAKPEDAAPIEVKPGEAKPKPDEVKPEEAKPTTDPDPTADSTVLYISNDFVKKQGTDYANLLSKQPIVKIAGKSYYTMKRATKWEDGQSSYWNSLQSSISSDIKDKKSKRYKILAALGDVESKLVSDGTESGVYLALKPKDMTETFAEFRDAMLEQFKLKDTK